MRDIDAAWLAGFLDGEGTFMVTRTTRATLNYPFFDAAIAASNTDERLVRRCADLCGGKVIKSEPKNKRHKTAYIWTLRGVRVGPVAKTVLPYLVGRVEQAKIVIELRAMTKRGSPKGRFGTQKTPEENAAREALYERCCMLNRRGNPDYVAIARKRLDLPPQ